MCTGPFSGLYAKHLFHNVLRMEQPPPAAFFSALDLNEQQALRQIAQERQFSAGQEIFRQGDPGDGIYIVIQGLVEIAHASEPSHRRIFSRFGPNEIFGEMAVIENLPRSAEATAAQDTRVYFISQDGMLARLQQSPQLAFTLLKEISRRLRDFNRLYLHDIIQAERLAVVGSFARSIFHDLKTPLTVIGLAVDTLEHSNVSADKSAQALNHIRNQTRHINEMIGEVLEFTGASRASAFAPADYRHFINELLPELTADAEIKSARIALENEPPPERILMDIRRLNRVFFNLIHNATDAMPGGGNIFVRFRQSDKEIITEIEDSGPGIAPEIADRLFQPFATHGKSHGTGLGLSICRKIIEDHGGRIWLRSHAGRGAIFSFALPVAK